MGKDYPWFALWRLLDPWVFTTPRALAEYPLPHRARHFLRRVKEEMLTLDGRPLYPTRIADTLGYALQPGAISEQTLYDQTTDYLENLYNRAKLLNRSAAKLAMSVLQWRLASSTWALLRSFERRLEKLEALIADVRQGRLSMTQLTLLQRELGEEGDPFKSHTADEESGSDGVEDNESAENRLLQSVIAGRERLGHRLALGVADVLQHLLAEAARVHSNFTKATKQPSLRQPPSGAGWPGTIGHF